MVLELHVWGPAFSLPSIDAQCLATVAYFQQVVPRDEWVLVASSDPSVAPTGELPALRNGSIWVSRFRNIVDYLRKYSGGAWGLDAPFTGLEGANCIAFSCFTESHGQALIDLYLYVSSQNYYSSTSPAYGSILQWPNQWLLPPKLHDAAKARTQHLGLSSLDLDAIEEQRTREHSAAVAAGKIPKNLIRKPQETVTKLLGRPSHQTHFRTEAITADFFEPLAALLGKKKYMLSGELPSSLDCLVVGYLSLVLVPDMPYPWLREALQAKAPTLAAYTDRLRQEWFGVVSTSDAFSETVPPTSKLPWQAAQRPSLAGIGTTVLENLADATPVLRDIRASNRLRRAASAKDSFLSAEESQALQEAAEAGKRDTYLSVASVTLGVLSLAGYVVYSGLWSALTGAYEEEEGEETDEGPASLGQPVDLGEAGQILAAGFNAPA